MAHTHSVRSRTCNQSLRCDYHRDHWHETNRCRSLNFMVEKLIKAGHLRRYIRETVCGDEATPVVERIAASAELPPKPRPTINYKLGGPADNRYQSTSQKKRLLSATIVRARVNTIHVPDSSRAVQPFDVPISFPPFNLPGSLLCTTMHSYLLCVLTILMCTEYWLTLATRPTYYSCPPSGR